MTTLTWMDRILERFDGLALLLSVVGLGSTGAAAALVLRRGDVMDGWQTLIIGLLLLTAAAVVGYYVLVTLARQQLHDRLALMRDAAHELGGGDLSVEVPEGDDDLGTLGASLNTMRGRVARLMTAQRELLSGVSHELRSPLARIQVALELIDMELPGDEEHEMVVGIREEVALLERHISRLLEAQRVTRDRVVLTRTELSIDALVKRVIDRDRLRLRKLGWRLQVSLAAGEELILADENALDRVLSTLIENAIRHAAQPGPEAAYSGSFEAVDLRAAAAAAVAAEAAAKRAAETGEGSDGAIAGDGVDGDAIDGGAVDGDRVAQDAMRAAGAGSGARWRPSLRVETEVDEHSVLIRFLDRGPGLSQEQCARVFEPFFRGDQSRSTSTGGTGLGMYLTRNILRAHGGDVLARPRDGGGLVVELRLPLKGKRGAVETMRTQWVDARDSA